MIIMMMMMKITNFTEFHRNVFYTEYVQFREKSET